MARPTTEKICIMCGKPFLPNGGRQKRCPDCKGNKPRAGRDTLTAAAQAAAELGISYGKYVAMSEEERNRAREEKTMAEQEKQTAEVTAEPEQAQDTLQEHNRYLNQQETELTARLEHDRFDALQSDRGRQASARDLSARILPHLRGRRRKGAARGLRR